MKNRSIQSVHFNKFGIEWQNAVQVKKACELKLEEMKYAMKGVDKNKNLDKENHFQYDLLVVPKTGIELVAYKY